MKVKIEPSFLEGEVTPPPSKSMLHRAIICASLSKGNSTIMNVNYSKDILATIDAFKKAGVIIEQGDNSITIKSKGSLELANDSIIDCNESGSTLRFLIPILSSKNKTINFTGKESLMKRPLSIYEDIYKQENIEFEFYNNKLSVNGELPAGEYNIPGNISSQFISGMLFHLPLMDKQSKINIIGTLESENYVKMTIDILLKFGIKIFQLNNSYIIPGNQSFIANDIIIETDFSQTAFFAVAGIINGNIKCNNINLHSLQGDKEIIKIISKMKGNITFNDNSIIVKKSETTGTDIDLTQIPDLAPILGVLLGLSKGESVLLNTQRLIIKESNRLETTFKVLTNLGVKCNIVENSLIIEGTKDFLGGTFDSYNDHRIAMMIAIASTRAKESVIIKNAEAINKSYPNFYKDFVALGGKLSYIEE